MDSLRAMAYLRRMGWDQEIDASDLLCPLPVLRARKRLKSMAPGTVLRLIATDPAAVLDVPHFCNEAGHELLASEETANSRVFLIRRGTPARPAQTPKPE